MWVIASAVFFGALFFVSYTYIGYPILIKCLSVLRPTTPKRSAINPTVSIILAARNEAAVIGSKIKNLLDLEYEPDKLQIIVINDGSTDDMGDVVAGFSDSRIEQINLEAHLGKPTAINRGVRHARGDILLFCDARQKVDQEALRTLVSTFADKSVGCASGELIIGSSKGPGIYWKYEKIIRMAESSFDSVCGATGAFFAARRELFSDIPADCLLDDVFTPMQIALKGFRVVFEPGARVFDREADLSGELKRKTRTLTGNYQLLDLLPNILNPFKNRLFFQYVSHKINRLLCPYALIGFFASNIYLLKIHTPVWPLYLSTFLSQVVFYGLACWGALKGHRANRFARFANTFVVLNLAAILGCYRYLRRDFTWLADRTPPTQ
ncbi:MAG: glycosyltransferase family 2 protein [Myxococcota bacterium]|nr:glycosyltransferase family 2 protein [Myxococcota bacterium]